MHISLINVPDKHDICELFNAVAFYGETLMSKRLIFGIDIKIVFIPKLEAHHKVSADCAWNDDNIRPREFIIRLDADMGKRKMFISLAHEMVHVKQYVKNEMRDMMRCASVTKWYRESIDTNNTDYWDLPWEIEAFGREAGLYVRFKKLWLKEKNYAKKAYEAQPNRAGTSHTLVLKKGCKESENL